MEQKSEKIDRINLIEAKNDFQDFIKDRKNTTRAGR